jgi:hypothetical protein
MAPAAADLLARMRAAANSDNVAGMARYGISTAVRELADQWAAAAPEFVKRNVVLHEAAVEVAVRLRDSGPRAARWVASDALRELTDPTVVARIRG